MRYRMGNHVFSPLERRELSSNELRGEGWPGAAIVGSYM